jgi:hypothetical protein
MFWKNAKSIHAYQHARAYTRAFFTISVPRFHTARVTFLRPGVTRCQPQTVPTGGVRWFSACWADEGTPVRPGDRVSAGKTDHTGLVRECADVVTVDPCEEAVRGRTLWWRGACALVYKSRAPCARGRRWWICNASARECVANPSARAGRRDGTRRWRWGRTGHGNCGPCCPMGFRV